MAQTKISQKEICSEILLRKFSDVEKDQKSLAVGRSWPERCGSGNPGRMRLVLGKMSREGSSCYFTSDVQCPQRVALSGMVEKQ